MKFIEEIVVDAFLPTVRSMLAEALAERGLTQREIAAAIGVSQSAVSKYVHGDVDRHPALADHGKIRTRVEEIADAVADDAMDPVGVLVELEVLIRELEGPGAVLARLHEEAVPALARAEGYGRIHDPDSRIRREAQVRSSVRRAVRQLERSPQFVELLPQVGANVVQALPVAHSVEDVAGIPGRIIDVEGRIEIPGDPSFGVSGHLAGVLLAARDAGSDARAAINVRHDEAQLRAMRDAGRSIVEIDGDRPIADAVSEVIADRPGAEVIAQPGAHGVEPITYLLGPDAPTVVRRALGLLEE